MNVAGSPIEAVLTLNATSFHTQLAESTKAVDNFKKSIVSFNSDMGKIDAGLSELDVKLQNIQTSIVAFNSALGSMSNIDKLSQAIKRISESIVMLGSDSVNIESGMMAINSVFSMLNETIGNTTISISGLSNAIRVMNETSQSSGYNVKSAFDGLQKEFMEMVANTHKWGSVMSDQEGRVIYQTQLMKNEYRDARRWLTEFANGGVEAFNRIETGIKKIKYSFNDFRSSFDLASQDMLNLGKAVQPLARIREQTDLMRNEFNQARASLLNFANTGVEAYHKIEASSNEAKSKAEQLRIEKERLHSVASRLNTMWSSSSGSIDKASSSMDRMTTQTNRLNRAMSSLRMMGTMVGSMMVYNFAHNLISATRETVNAKSEMEGYFQMLNFSTSQVDNFNRALDETVAKFPRLNKYALGETISSIGVEFELTTKEMEKAMPVVSMITSEYLRAGRNVNEASLAVKDILQGEFQRLSRETGVKGDQLIEAGWSGDKSDVMGLLEALEKVGKSRNWDVFVTKANSLNDAVLILQNRFGEWSADMVNAVQPAILGVFNALMDVGGMVASALEGIFTSLSNNSFMSIAVQVGAVSVALSQGLKFLTMYRTGSTLLQTSTMSLKNAIGGLVFGLKAEQMANMGVANSITAKILGLKAETVAEKGLTGAINLSTATTRANTVANQMNTASQYSGISAGISKYANMLKDNTATGMNTAIIQANTFAKTGNTGVTIGFTEAVMTMIAGEEFATGSTLTLSGAIGVLTTTMLMNPFTWFVAGLMAIAGAIYVVTGGLDEHWDKMKRFNEALDNSDDLVQSNADYLERLGKNIGEDSDWYRMASESVEEFNQKLGSSKALVKAYNDEMNSLGVSLSTIVKMDSKNLGVSPDQLKELSKYATGLDEGYNTYYRALQVLHKQQDDFGKSDRTFIQNMRDRGAEEEDITEKREQHLKHWNDYMKHSAEHNTSDDWWSGSWAGFLAWLDSIQIWLDYKTEDLANWFHDFNEQWSQFGKDIEESISGFGDWISGGWNKLQSDFSNWINDVGKSLSDSWKSLEEMWNNNIAQPLQELWGGFWSFDWLFGESVSASDGSTDHPSFMEDISNIIGFDIQSWIDSFTSDPMSTLGIDLSGFDIVGTLRSLIFGSGEESEDSGDTSWINTLLQPIDPALILTYVQTNITQPLGTGIYNGIMQIPIVSDILQLLGFTTQAHSDASTKGDMLARAFGNAVETTVRNIPILGDILQFLGIIPQANGTAYQDGHGVGENIKKGESAGHQGIADNVRTEMGNVISAISSKFGEAYSTAHDIGSRILNGIKDALDMHSPSIISRELIANEFGVYIPQSISDAGSVAYTTAQEYAMNIKQGIADAGTTTIGMDGMVQDYETDAQTIATSSQMMGVTTTTAFNDMSASVNATTGQMATDVGTQYTSIQQKQGTMLTTMKNQNLTAYNDMYLKSNQSLIQMRDSTSNVTNQMVGAWNHMKDNIIASANHLKSQSTSHFNQLSSTIGDFYGKIQNPARWGSGSVTPSNVSKRTPRNSSFGRSIAHAFTRHGAGGNPTGGKHTGSSVMTVGQAKRLLCPSGECGNLFEGYSLTDKIDINDLFATMSGEHGFGWNDWNGRHFNYIRTTSNKWDMKSPRINLAGGIDTNTNFKVGEFENGRPNVSFSTFQSIAGDIFSRIPYKLYYDSSWKGSWLGALQAGACNCSDGADALIALASVFGFSGYKQWGKWGNTGHFWAVINGVPMDTTAWQGGYGWTSPKVSGYGSPNIRRASPSFNEESTANKTVNVTVDMSNSTIYGVEDLDNRIEQGVRRGLREEFNDSYSVII